MRYEDLKQLINEFKAFEKAGKVKKLKGYYMINDRGQLYCIDFIKNFDIKTKKAEQKI